MKLVLALIAAIRGDDDFDENDYERVDEDLRSTEFDSLMEEGDVGKWGARCTVPTTTGGTWQCYNANGPAYAPNGRKKRDATGRWGAPTVPVIVCKLSCQGGYDLSGSYIAVCERNTGHWRRPGTCVYRQPKCTDLTARFGQMACSGSVYSRTCQLFCPSTHQPSGGTKFHCINGKWNGSGDCEQRNLCVMPAQKPSVWNGKYTCKRRTCESGPPNMNMVGRKRRDDDEELNLDEIGKWGAPAPSNDCIVCYLNCNPMHQAKGGYRAQCRISTGEWFEPMNPVCKFGHNCYWPDAGPMGEYICESNIVALGYKGDQFEAPEKPSKNDDDRSGAFEYSNWQPGDPYLGAARARRDTEGLKPRWSPPPTPPPAPSPPWWEAEWHCTIDCARFHYPQNGQPTAVCKLKDSSWIRRPTECVYKSPCPDPRPNGGRGVYQCYETTTLNVDGKIVRRRSANETEEESPNPLGRWGPPKKPDADRSKWDFNVQKVCHLNCPDCYTPSQATSICVNGEWQVGHGQDTFGSCIMTEKCPDRPWWPVGNGQWHCNDFDNLNRRCSLRCDPFHIVQPHDPPLPVPASLDPAFLLEQAQKELPDYRCKEHMDIPNGWMECNVQPGNPTAECMIMCDRKHRPMSDNLMAVCKKGLFFPAMPANGAEWACVPGDCDAQKYGMACKDYHKQIASGRKRREEEEPALSANLPDDVYADDAQNSLGRWGVAVSSSSTCDNCDGYWGNQIKCVFNTRCNRPQRPVNGNIQCARDPEGKMMHRCSVTCEENYKLWPPGCKMSCDPMSGIWNKCSCEWNKKCEKPDKPNARYTCEENPNTGIYECALTCKGNGNYVPARWPDIWKFHCKRGEWIEREPQGCKFEPPCEPPTVENAVLKNCRFERCQAPRKVYEELMPGQANYVDPNAPSPVGQTGVMIGGVPTGTHVGYTGKGRRAAGFFPGEVIPDKPAVDRWGTVDYGACPTSKPVDNGYIHCHDLGTSGGGAVAPPTGGGSVENPGFCQMIHDIENGWMECKPESGSTWICMIMCYENTLPSSSAMFANCNGGHIPGDWRCVPGYCDVNVYKEACWNPNHPNNPVRRSIDYPGAFDQLQGDEYNNQLEMADRFDAADSVEQGSDRWMPPPPPPPPPPADQAICTLQCNHGFMPKGEILYKCDTMTGIFAPYPTGCVAKPTRAPPTEDLVWANCMCCDMKCGDWFLGDGQAKCTKGYWWRIDECEKYTMCNQPDHPKNGEYKCHWEDFASKKEAKQTMKQRREVIEDIDYDRSDDSDEEDVFNGDAQFFKERVIAGTNGTNPNAERTVNGQSWGDIPTKKLVCKLKCNDGFMPRTKSALCVNGDWLQKPTVCDKDPDYVEWDPSLSTCKLPKKANKENTSGGKWHCKARMLNPNERSIESERQLAQEDGYTLITEKSTIAALVGDDFVNRWQQERGPGKHKKPFVVCKLKCGDGYENEGDQLAKCDMEAGSWTQQATGKCNPIPWEPEESECKLPKKVNKELQNGKWSCKTKLSNDYRGEDDYDTAGQVIITDETQWADLLDQNESGEWRKEKNKNKEMVMCCTLNCDPGFKPSGRNGNTANCAMKSNTWYGDFSSVCVADWQPQCAVPAKPEGGSWQCATMLTDPSQRNSDLPKLVDVDGMTTQDLINRNPGQAERWYQEPELEYMLVCQLYCMSSHVVSGNNVVKCNLDTGAWNSALPTCVAWTPQKETGGPPSPEKGKNPKKQKKEKGEKKNKKTKEPKPSKPSKALKKFKKQKLKLKAQCDKGSEQACKDLDKLKKEKAQILGLEGNRTDGFEFMLPDFTAQCGEGKTKCHKREMQKFCVLHPDNFYC